jgi:hypothetical protein
VNPVNPAIARFGGAWIVTGRSRNRSAQIVKPIHSILAGVHDEIQFFINRDISSIFRISQLFRMPRCAIYDIRMIPPRIEVTIRRRTMVSPPAGSRRLGHAVPGFSRERVLFRLAAWLALASIALCNAAHSQAPDMPLAKPTAVQSTKVDSIAHPGARHPRLAAMPNEPERRGIANRVADNSRPYTAGPRAGRRFTADFSHQERPISADGAWRHAGAYWAVVRTIDGHAIGTQTGSGGYDDSYAYLSGFTADQAARATLWFDHGVDGDFREVELLLRWVDSGDRARGYECNLAWNGAYAEIVRWNGGPGDFTYISQQRRFGLGLMPPATGDTFSASIIGSVIRVYLNKHDGRGDQLLVTGQDATFQDGDPGMGFFIQGNVDPTRFGFSDYTATSE